METNEPIQNLEIPTRTKNALWNMGIHTVADVLSKNQAQLLKGENMGRKGLDALLRRLSESNLQLSDSEATVKEPVNFPKVRRSAGSVSCKWCGELFSSRSVMMQHKFNAHAHKMKKQMRSAQDALGVSKSHKRKSKKENTNGHAATYVYAEKDGRIETPYEGRDVITQERKIEEQLSFATGYAFGHCQAWIDYFCQEGGNLVSPVELAYRVGRLLAGQKVR